MRKTYKEAMNQLAVSDELRERVLAAASVKYQQPRQLARWLKPVCGLAACVAVVGAAGIWTNLYKNGGLNTAGSISSGAPVASTANAAPQDGATGGMAKDSGGNTANYAAGAAPEMADGAAPQNDLADQEAQENTRSNEFGLTAAMGSPIVSYETIEEAEAALSFSPVIPLSLTEPTVLEDSEISVIDGVLLQISWQDEEVRYTYRAAEGEQDISGDYEAYYLEEIVEISDEAVTLKGDGETFSVALWQENGQSCAILADPGVQQELLTALAAETFSK